MTEFAINVVDRAELQRRLDRRVSKGDLSETEAASILSRFGRWTQEDEERADRLAAKVIDDVFHRYYQSRRIGGALSSVAFSETDERYVVEATIELANARDQDEIAKAVTGFRLWYDTLPASRDELGEAGLDVAAQRALELSELAQELARRLRVVMRGSAADRKRLREDLMFIPPRLIFASDYDVDAVGRVKIAFSMIESRLHDAADFACLLLLDPSRDFGAQLRRCEYRKCGRYFVAASRRAMFCPARTGRNCKDRHHYKITGAERSRRSRAEKRRREAESNLRGDES